MNKNVCTITFPPLAEGNPNKVTIRQFSIVDSADNNDVIPPQDYMPDITEVTDIKLTQDVQVVLRLIDTNGGGTAHTHEEDFTPTDQVMTDRVGGFGIDVTDVIDE